ncbi:MAG: ribosomal-protein-alanine N-acetyltransferase [Maribacter sp.]|jgi:ribosomal-protein-alanine N-acetyltransferase
MEIILHTQRLYLRECNSTDALLAYELNVDPEVIKYTGDPPFASVSEAKTFLENYDAFEKYGMGRWYAFLRDTDEFIGWCGLKYSPKVDEVDIGYRLLKKHWNRGYSTEAARACLDYGFQTLGIEEIVARSDKRNQGSIRVMEKIGMKHDKDIIFDEYEGVMYKISSSWTKEI